MSMPAALQNADVEGSVLKDQCQLWILKAMLQLAPVSLTELG